MSRYHRVAVSNRDVAFEIVRRWRKTNEFVIRTKGRWGPAWLHRLVLRMAKNLGILGHMAMYAENETVRVVDIDTTDKKFGEAVYRAAECYLNRDLYPKDLIVLCGPEQLRDGMMEATGADIQFRAKVGIGGLHGRSYSLYDFDVSVIDQLKGMVVVPKSALY